jgi:hypothetical protein
MAVKGKMNGLRFFCLLNCLVFLVLTLGFIFFSNEIFSFCNELSLEYFPSYPLSLETEKFWYIQGISLFLVISFLSFMVFYKPQEYLKLAIALILIHFTALFTGEIFFAQSIFSKTNQPLALSSLTMTAVHFLPAVFITILYIRAKKGFNR